MLDFTFDVYRRDRDGLLATRGSQLTNTFGASLPEENLNADRTEGIEFTLGHRNKIGQVSYGVQGNFNFARSKMTRQIHGQYESSWDVWKSATEGRWSGIGWGYTTAGQFQNYDQIYNAPVQSGDRGNTMILPGDYYLQDVNGDGYIDGNDMKPKYYGLNMPALNYGVTLTAEWKWFDFMALFQGSSLLFYPDPPTTCAIMHLGKVIHLLICMTDGIVKIRLMQTATGFGKIPRQPAWPTTIRWGTMHRRQTAIRWMEAIFV